METATLDSTAAPFLPSTVVTRAKRSVLPQDAAFWTILVGAPATTYFAVTSTRSKTQGLLAAAGVALGVGLARAQMARWFSAEPAYRVLWRVGPLSVREYPPQVLASTIVTASNIRDALEAGFDRVGGYIFGRNKREEKLPMTSPVTASHRVAGRYEVAFIMPPGRALETLPKPEDDAIQLRAMPTRYVAALRFHGRFTTENIEAHMETFRRLTAREGLALHGMPTFAGFDPPMTLPVLRRNEICAELAV